MYKLIRTTPEGSQVLTFQSKAEVDAALTAWGVDPNSVDIQVNTETESDEDMVFANDFDFDTATPEQLVRFRELVDRRLLTLVNALELALAVKTTGSKSPLELAGIDMVSIPACTVETLMMIVESYAERVMGRLDEAIANNNKKPRNLFGNN